MNGVTLGDSDSVNSLDAHCHSDARARIPQLLQRNGRSRRPNLFPQFNAARGRLGLETFLVADAMGKANDDKSRHSSLVNATPFVDTHEHLMEESIRLASLHQTVPNRALSDFSVFFAHYADSDLHAACLSRTMENSSIQTRTSMRNGVSLLHFMSTRGTQDIC